MQNQDSIIDDFCQRLIRRKARRLAGRYGYSVSDREDLEQELYLFLLTKLRELDKPPTNREAFVMTLLNHHASSLIRRMRAQKRDRRRQLSLSVQVPDEDGELVPWERLISEEDNHARRGHAPLSEPERLDLVSDVATVLTQMPPDLRRLCQLLKEFSVTECACKLGISRTTLIYQLQQVRQEFEKAGLAPEIREFFDT